MRVHVADTATKERDKYFEIWRDVPEYKNYSPGLENVERFMQVMQPHMGDNVLDAGCGAGVAGLELAKSGLDVAYLDITAAGLDPGVDRRRFIEAPLWQSLYPRNFRFGFCCDVMEHIPPEYTMLSLKHIIEVCADTWFQISLVPDEFGRFIGRPLHLTVESFVWWRDRLASLATVVEARDLGSNAVFVVRRR